jgi:lauroyl/myristoyl acyltransferase
MDAAGDSPPRPPEVRFAPSVSSPSTLAPSLPIRAAGALAVLLLRGLGALPTHRAQAILAPAARLYPRLRRHQAARLRACFSASPCAETLDLRTYYRSRLGLLLSGLRAHGRPVTAAFPRRRVEGEDAYARALASGRPVVLLGLHAGPWELSHRLPAAPPDRPFAILTAPAFAPALTAYMAAGRERDGKRILWVGGGDRGLETGLRSILDSRGVLAMMADQVPGPAEACEYLKLWGKIRSPYPGRLLRFLESRGCVFVPVSARMETPGSAHGREGALGGRENTAVLTFHGAWDEAGPEQVRAFLEGAISRSPDQWNWSYPKVVPDR